MTALFALLLVLSNVPLAVAQDCNVDPNGVDVECDGTADIVVTKVADATSVAAGETFAYHIIVNNFGPDPAENVVIRDYLITDGPVTVQSCELSVRTEGGVIARFDCTTGAVDGVVCLGDHGVSVVNPVTFEDPGAVRIRYRLIANEARSLNDITVVSSDCFDPNPDNNIATAPILVSATADLGVTKTAIGEVQVPGESGSVVDIANPPAFPDGPAYTTSDTEVTAGRRIAYTIEVENNGPSTADNVIVRDRLPAGVTIVPGTLSAAIFDVNDVQIGTGSCETGAPGDPFDLLECGLGTLNAGPSPGPGVGEEDARVRAVISFQVRVDPGVAPGAVLENDVTVSSDEIDLDNTNDRAFTETIVNTWADLGLLKFAIGTPRAGGLIHYEYQIRNRGPSVARDVTLRDFLPSEIEVISALVDVEGGLGGVPLACDTVLGSNSEFCPLGDIPPTGDLAVLVFLNVRIRADVPDGTALDNNADVFLADTDDPETSDNSASATVNVRTTADVAIEKTADREAVYAGDRIKYTIHVTNHGPSDAQNVTVMDVLPPEATFEFDTDNCLEGPPGMLTCSVGTLGSGESKAFDVFCRVNPDVIQGSVILNEVQVTSETGLGDENPDNDSATARAIVEARADLRITKFGKPDGNVQAGDELTYTIIVDNLGPNPASGVAIKDLMQSDGDFDVLEIESDRAMTCSSLPQADGGNPFSVPPADGAATGVTERYQLDCSLDDPLDVLQADGPPNTGRWVVTVRVKANERQDIDNVADVLSAVADPNLANNHAEVEHAIDEVVDLALEKVANPNQGPPNGLVTYILTVTNNGPSTANNVVVTDVVPAEFAIGGVTPSQGVCDIGTPGDPADPTTCLLGTIAAGDSATINIDVVLPPDEIEATYYNRATVVGDQFDPDNSNNLAIAPVTVVLPPPQTQPAEKPAIGLCGPAPAMSLALTAIGLVGMRRRFRR